MKSKNLSHAILVLLIDMTEQGLFSQEIPPKLIAKEVGFRFCDLQRFFDPNFLPDVNPSRPVVRLLFPKTIDKMNKESSLDESTPMLLADQDIELLFLGAFRRRGIQKPEMWPAVFFL